jgi:hypothetical protein
MVAAGRPPIRGWIVLRVGRYRLGNFPDIAHHGRSLAGQMSDVTWDAEVDFIDEQTGWGSHG